MTPCEIRGPLLRTPLEQLGVRRDRAQRRAQLVGGVGDELAELLLGGGTTPQRVLDVSKHEVERCAEPAHLGPVVLRDPETQVAAGDARGRRLDVAQWSQSDANEPQADPTAAMSAAPVTTSSIRKSRCSVRFDLVERQRHQEDAAAAELLARTRNCGPSPWHRRSGTGRRPGGRDRRCGPGGPGPRSRSCPGGAARDQGPVRPTSRTSTYAPGAAAASAA